MRIETDKRKQTGEYYAPVTFDHLTLQTGHNYEQINFVPEGSEELRGYFVRLGLDGLHDLGGSGLTVRPRHHTSDHVEFSVNKGKDALVVCHGCLSADSAEDTWDRMLRCVRADSDVLPFSQTIRRPQSRYLAVGLTSFMFLYPSWVPMLGDIERCVYWAAWSQRQRQLGAHG